MSNIIKTIIRIASNPIIDVQEHYISNNRANSAGGALEEYIKDSFADSFKLDNAERLERWNTVFSYLGNQNNPPDIMIRNGDAIETKKVESPGSALALNSSYPKAKLHSNSPMITNACRESENWDSKDIIYSVGHVVNKKLKCLWLVYGDCFCANKEIYERIKNTISDGINSIPDVEFTETNELGKINKVDPLGITDLRVRGMWHIKNPKKIFEYLNLYSSDATFQLISIMKTEKYNSFSDDDRNNLENLNIENFSISGKKIKNPNNPAQLIDCKVISFRS
jgi:hypothetical protein